MKRTTNHESYPPYAADSPQEERLANEIYLSSLHTLRDENDKIMAETSDKKYTKSRHYFFLNPYKDAAFTRCPKCQGKTKLRKFPLVIHVEPQQIVLLNKKCRYCTGCDLIIVKQSELETLMIACLEDKNPAVIGNEYFTMGVLERKDWKEASKDKIDTNETLNRMYMFKDALDFEPMPLEWHPAEKLQ